MTDREVIERHGFDPDTTPIDRLMAGPDTMHRRVAVAMENEQGDDY